MKEHLFGFDLAHFDTEDRDAIGCACEEAFEFLAGALFDHTLNRTGGSVCTLRDLWNVLQILYREYGYNPSSPRVRRYIDICPPRDIESVYVDGIYSTGGPAAHPGASARGRRYYN